MRQFLRTIQLGALVPALVIALVAFTGCGSDQTEQTDAGGGAEAPAEEASDAVVVEANDQLQFSVNEFTVQAGEEVTVTLKNVGSLPKETFGHNLVILQMGNEIAAFAESALNAKANDYIPQDMTENIVANTALLGPGEEDTITFTAPSEPGEYPFLCSFPGHYGTMQGVMIVE